MTVLTCAIQFGSSRILAIAAQKDLQTGALLNIQIESEPTEGCIKHGLVVNTELAAKHLRSIIKKLNNRTLSSITAAYVSVGGMSLHSLKQQPSVQIPDYDVLSSEPMESGDCQLIVGLKALRQGIKTAMDRAGIRVIGYIAQPLATATIISSEERQQGCLLVDMGAASTTVAIYKNGHLQHLAVIPLGGQCVTNDIQSAGCNAEDAERVKVDWSDVSKEVSTEATANNPVSTLFGDKTLPIPQSKLNNIALCRYEEIVANIRHQIEISGQDKLEAGCIITGGAAMQRGLTSLISRCLSISRVEIRAYKEPVMRGSERKTHLTNLLGLLNFCTKTCIDPAEAPKPASNQPAAAGTSEPAKPVAPASNPNEPTLFPDESAAIEEQAAETPNHSTIKESLWRFAKDLITGQN